MSSLTNCMYTAQGEIVCVPNKNKTSQESQLIETFKAVQKPQPKQVVSTNVVPPSKKCKTNAECPSAQYLECNSGWCVPKNDPTS